LLSDRHRLQRRFPHCSLLSCLLECQPCQLVRFVGGNLPKHCGSVGIGQMRRRAATVGISDDDGCDGAGMARRQCRIDRTNGGPTLCTLAGDEQINLGIVQRPDGFAAKRPDALSLLPHFGGRPVFKGAPDYPSMSAVLPQSL
jgi:hypothetical protein